MESLCSAPPAGSGVTDGGYRARPVVAGWVDARHCVPVRVMSRSTETGASPQRGAVLFNSHTITVLIMVTRLRRWIMFSLKYMQAYRVHLSPYFPVYVYCKEQNVWGHFISLSVTLSLPLFAIILGIKCHCFDTIAQTQKWFLKGDRAISLLLDLWGWRGPACLSEQKKKGGDDRVSHHLPKFIFNSHTQTHTSSGGGGGE